MEKLVGQSFAISLLAVFVLVGCNPQQESVLELSPIGPAIVAGSAAIEVKATLRSEGTLEWILSPDIGSLDQIGNTIVRYTPPSNVVSNIQVTLTAAVVGTSIRREAVFEVLPSSNPSIRITPISVRVMVGDSPISFSAQVPIGATNTTWSLSPAIGSLSSESGLQTQYTPPKTISNETKVLLTAQTSSSVKTYTEIIILPNINSSLRISPSAISLDIWSIPVQFDANLQGLTGNVRWEISPNLGTLSSTQGNRVSYTPPRAKLTDQVTLTAVLENTSIRASTQINLTEPAMLPLNSGLAPSRSLRSTLPECSGYAGTIGNDRLVGYTTKTSYAPGENLELRVNAPAGRFGLVIYREGLTPTRLLQRDNLSAGQYLMPVRAYRNSPNWPVAFQMPVPSDWRSGLYTAALVDPSSRLCFEVVFTIRNADNAAKAPIAVLASDYTWQAYNNWGGASFYLCTDVSDTECIAQGNFRFSPVVTLQRPNNVAYIRKWPDYDHLSLGTFSLIHWLEQNGFSYNVISDSDLDSIPNLLDRYRVLILDRHSEYFTNLMFNQTEQFLSRGGNLVSFGANQMYWKTVAQNGLIEARKDDSRHTLADEPGGLWRSLGRPESALLGNRYNYAGFGTYSGYAVINPNHWVFAGTNLAVGQVFGEGCSGWETDKIDAQNSPRNLELVARGVNLDTERFGQAGADMVYYENSAGAEVFSAGSLIFGTCAANDPVVSRIMRNVLNRFLVR